MSNIKDTQIEMVWQKGIPIPGLSPFLWRKDDFGNLIYRFAYGDRHSKYGWEIDHIRPRLLRGSDDLSNLRPVQAKLNAARQPRRPVRSSGKTNPKSVAFPTSASKPFLLFPLERWHGSLENKGKPPKPKYIPGFMPSLGKRSLLDVLGKRKPKSTSSPTSIFGSLFPSLCERSHHSVEEVLKRRRMLERKYGLNRNTKKQW